MQVTKRNGKKEEFSKDKIFNAISLANDSTKYKYKLTKAKLHEIADIVENTYVTTGKTRSVEVIQDMIEESLVDAGAYGVAKAYITYRYKSDVARGFGQTFLNEIIGKLGANNIQNQNANVDEQSFGGRMGEATSTLTKRLALETIVSKKARENHENNMIYLHDLDQYYVGSHNCLSCPLDDLLANGFNTRQSDVRPAGSVSTAFQLLAVIFQLQSLQQFGGVSATHLDYTMAPYVRLSFLKHFNKHREFVSSLPLAKARPKIILDNPKEVSIEDYSKFKISRFSILDNLIYKFALKDTQKEVYQAAEGMFHNLNTLQSRSGNQLPFTSINFGTCTFPEGRMVTKALLEVSIEGLGKLYKTSIFPCSIFQYKKGINDRPGTPNYDLYKLALKSTAQRLYPNYMNCTWSVDEKGNERDIENKEKYLNSLNSVEMEKLVKWCEENPELAKAFKLQVVDE